MICKLIEEIAVALQNELYLLALSAALTLPDVCGKAEYPKEGVSARYKKWYSTFVPDGNLSADSVYALRCNLLHEGSVEVNAGDKKTKNGAQIKAAESRVIIRLMTNSIAHPLGVDFSFCTKITHADGTSETRVDVYVGFLCTVICNAAKMYYEQNKEKFGFLNYSIVDMAQKLGAIGYEV